MLNYQSIAEVFKSLRDEYGHDIPILYDAYYLEKYLDGLTVTIKLSCIVLLFSFMIGFVGGTYRIRAGRLGGQFIDGYVAVFRNTPALAQLYFFYFGLGSLLLTAPEPFSSISMSLGGVFWLCLALSLHFGAYNIEAFRAGLEAVPSSTMEAAHSLGYSAPRATWRIQIPLAFRIALPSLSNSLVQLIKTTAIGYAIAVPEILYVANRVWTEKLNVLEMMNVVLLTYLVLIGIAVFLTGCLERMLRIPGTANA